MKISKNDFGRWCDDQGHDRPQFWFGSEAQDQKSGQQEASVETQPKKSVASSEENEERTTVSSAKPRGRPRKSAFGVSDAPLVDKMRTLLVADGDLSTWAAAQKVVDCAERNEAMAGGGTQDSKAKRLMRRYKERFSEIQRK